MLKFCIFYGISAALGVLVTTSREDGDKSKDFFQAVGEVGCKAITGVKKVNEQHQISQKLGKLCVQTGAKVKAFEAEHRFLNKTNTAVKNGITKIQHKIESHRSAREPAMPVTPSAPAFVEIN